MSALLEHLRRPSISNAPPSDEELRRNDWVTIAWFLFILFLGFGIRNNALSAGEIVTLGDNLVQITVPAGWVRHATTSSTTDATGSASPLAVSLWNSRSASAFDAAIQVRARRLRPGENLTMARAALGVQRSQELSRYRELQADPVTVLNLVPGTRITYAYIADPTRTSGAPGAPVVVQGQDLLFVYRDHLIQVTVAADNAHWEDEARAFALVFDSLRLQEALP
jgi:hypothetical protein